MPVRPIVTAHLFPKIERLLIELLESLGPDEWERQTLAPQWKVKDVAAHLLDTQLRKLSRVRDGYVDDPTPAHSLVALVDQLNQRSVTVYRRLSPRVLIALMADASRESAEYHQSLDPFAPATFAVSWAGDTTSPNWFDTAREYTERWHHQQQIRLAVDRPAIMTPELYRPVLDCFMRALPFTYRDTAAAPGTLLRFDIAGDCGGTWMLRRDHLSWRLAEDSVDTPMARVVIPQEIAWRIFTKAMRRDVAAAQVQVEGDRELGLRILDMVAIIG
ncbi:MAG TPA: maleylpyruvate isomerase N-terminal domain-containing protein [Gemmatimonadaceae bacterium]|nr:maleylpyruvate isomerase N-terminal domain-containing protein [Gemmatimonadaceae bacterium]